MTGDLRALLDATLQAARENPRPDEPDERVDEIERARKLAIERGVPSRLASIVAEVPEQTEAIKAAGRWFRGTATALVLAGPPGVGKSVAAARVIARSRAGALDAFPVFCNAEGYVASFSAKDASGRRLARRVERSNVLALDDLGVEYLDARGYNLARVCYLLEQRLDDERRTIITTNLDREQFASRYGGRVVSRLAECGAWADIAGPDRRIRT